MFTKGFKRFRRKKEENLTIKLNKYEQLHLINNHVLEIKKKENKSDEEGKGQRPKDRKDTKINSKKENDLSPKDNKKPKARKKQH